MLWSNQMARSPTTRAALWTHPAKVIDRIRRNTDTRIFLLEALVVVYSFTAAAFRSDWPSIHRDPGALVRLAIPASAALFGLMLRDALTGRVDRPPHASAVDATVAYALALLSELILSVLEPDLALPRWGPTQGGFVGISLLVASRSLFPPRAKLQLNGRPICLPEIRGKAGELGKRSSYSMRAYLATSALLGSIALYFILTGSPRARAASCIILAGTAYLVYQIHELGFPAAAVSTNASFNKCLDSYRSELQRQHAFLQRASYWFYGSLLPGVLLALLGSPVYPYWLPLVVLIAAELIHRAADNLREELNALNASQALKQLSPTG